MGSLSEKISAHFRAHKEQAFILKAFVTIAVILSVREYLLGYLRFVLFILLPCTFMSAVLAWSAYTGERIVDILKGNLTLIPTIHAEKGEKREKAAWITYSIILLNIAVFYLVEMNPLLGDGQFIFDNLLFLPEKPNLWNVPVGAVTSMFLHADHWHLWGNMMFLWAIGSEVERRVAGRRFLGLYLATGIMAGVIQVSVCYLYSGEASNGLGASGAISGLMGVYAVRCYFRTMVFPVPVLGFLPISFKVRMNALVLMGLFFMLDLGGGIDQMTGESLSNVGHWAHLGGMLAGFLLAGRMSLGEAAIEERHEAIGLQRLKEGTGLGEGEESLRTVLSKNENNIEATLALARMKSRRHGLSHTLTEEGRDCYEKAIRLLVAARPNEAADVYIEYYNKYLKGVAAPLQYRIASILYRKGDLNNAGRALELLVEAEETPPDVMENALFQSARIMEEMGLDDAARRYQARLLELFPHSAVAEKVRRRMNA